MHEKRKKNCASDSLQNQTGIQIEKICESQFSNTFFTEITYFSVRLKENYRIVQCPISFTEKKNGEASKILL